MLINKGYKPESFNVALAGTLVDKELNTSARVLLIWSKPWSTYEMYSKSFNRKYIKYISFQNCKDLFLR